MKKDRARPKPPSNPPVCKAEKEMCCTMKKETGCKKTVTRGGGFVRETPRGRVRRDQEKKKVKTFVKSQSEQTRTHQKVEKETNRKQFQTQRVKHQGPRYRKGTGPATKKVARRKRGTRRSAKSSFPEKHQFREGETGIMQGRHKDT